MFEINIHLILIFVQCKLAAIISLPRLNTSIYPPRVRICGDNTTLPNTPSRHAALINHSENLNFTHEDATGRSRNRVSLNHLCDKISNAEIKTTTFLSMCRVKNLFNYEMISFHVFSNK